MKMSNNERNVFCSLLGRSIKNSSFQMDRVTIDKMRYIDQGIFSLVARITWKSGLVEKRVYLSNQIGATEGELVGFARKRYLPLWGDFNR